MLVWGFFISTVAGLPRDVHDQFACRMYSGASATRPAMPAATILWLAIITLGRAGITITITIPSSVRQGFYWWEFDVTFYMLKLMSFLGVIWDLKPVPAAVRDGGGKRL